MAKLSAAQIYRAGRTARTLSLEGDRVELDVDRDDHELQFTFSLSSKGGGVTQVMVTIGSKDFLALSAAMAKADRGTAVRDMSATLTSELAKQAELDAEMIQAARESVVEAAHQAWLAAPNDNDDIESATLKRVRSMVEKLNEAKDSKSKDGQAD